MPEEVKQCRMSQEEEIKKDIEVFPNKKTSFCVENVFVFFVGNYLVHSPAASKTPVPIAPISAASKQR